MGAGGANSEQADTDLVGKTAVQAARQQVLARLGIPGLH